MPRIIPPTPAPDDQYFWAGVARDALLLQRCASCSALRHPPGPMCGVCNSLEWDTQESTGRGEIYSWIDSHHPSEPDAQPRVVILVELEEGVRIVSNLREASREQIRNGLPVEVFFVEEDGVKLPQFRPREGGAS